MAAQLNVRRRYTRDDPRGRFPRVTGAPELGYNRIGRLWRPIVDMTHTDVAPMRLAMIKPVTDWIADPRPGRVSWFSRIGVPGLRSQVLRHAGLDAYDAGRPQDLPGDLRTPAWQLLVDALGEFASLDPYTRALVVFQLAQLSFCRYATELTGVVPPADEPGLDHLAYQSARAYSRIPGQAAAVMPVFEALTGNRHDRQLAMLSAAQGVGQGVRSLGDVALSQRFERLGRRLAPEPALWQDHLARSRFHRAVALLRIAEKNPAGMREELRAAWYHHEELASLAPTDKRPLAGPAQVPADHEVTTMVVAENRRILIESEIKAKFRVDEEETTGQLRTWARELAALDPNCVEARLVVGDAHAAAGDGDAAAQWYARAGELGTAAGANGWYRAAQCYHQLGEYDRAVDAMGHCLELDTTAVEPRRYLLAAADGVPA